MDVSLALKKRGLTLIQNLFEELRMGKRADVTIAEKWIDDLITEISQKSEGKLNLVLNTGIADYVFAHSVNVALLSTIMANKMSISGLELKEIGLGALLHDIGKINTPDDLMWKQTGLTPYEVTTIREHPVFGSHWLATNSTVSEEVASIVKDHHETFDGKGYPAGVSDRDFSRGVKIVAICNYFSFLTSKNPDSEPMKEREVCFIISQLVNKTFSLKIVMDFLNYMGPMILDGPLFQKTALLLLDTKEVAAVMKTESFGDLYPEIMILTNSKGMKLPRPLVISLKNDKSRKILKILKG